MGLAAQQQVRQMYVGTAPNATVTDLATLKSAGVSGDMVVLSPDATAVSSGEGFQLFQKDSLGKVLSSDVILPEQVLYAKSVEGVAEQKAVWTVSDIVADAGTLYTVNIAINHYGSLSAEDTCITEPCDSCIITVRVHSLNYFENLYFHCYSCLSLQTWVDWTVKNHQII